MIILVVSRIILAAIVCILAFYFVLRMRFHWLNSKSLLNLRKVCSHLNDILLKIKNNASKELFLEIYREFFKFKSLTILILLYYFIFLLIIFYSPYSLYIISMLHVPLFNLITLLYFVYIASVIYLLIKIFYPESFFVFYISKLFRISHYTIFNKVLSSIIKLLVCNIIVSYIFDSVNYV
jgi:hypothetical protein